MPIAAVLTAAAIAWFGPAQVSFEAALPGNPYDFHANDVRVRFVADDGHREERLAFFDDGQWKAWLATAHPATYRATLVRNGETVPTAPATVTITAAARPAASYVRVQGTRFVTDAGEPFFPLGHNLGWQQPNSPTLLMQLRDMGAARMNWTRIWACSWDGKNPFFQRNQPAPAPGELLPEPLRQWDELISVAEQTGVRLQLVFFHHGLFSTEVNPNWDEHAWNAKNGGFLERPQDFFTHPTARDYSQRWLRHAVARWGHSPAIFAWELFNEVEWVDLVRKDHDWATVAAWHADMAAFVREIDPYDHLITTSSALEHPALYDAMDFYQPHIYTRNITVAIAGRAPLPGKPWFYGEFGGNAFGSAAPDESSITRDGLWASVLAGHSGGAGYWYWERVAQQRFAHEFTRVARALEISGLPARTDARPVPVGLTGASAAPLVFGAGQGWGATETHVFHLPEDLTPEKLARLSSYIRGPNPLRPDVRSTPPIELHFTAPAAGEASVALAAVGGNGSGLSITLDGKPAFSESWPALDASVTGQARLRIGSLPEIKIPYEAGAHVLTLRCLGPDWVQLGSVMLPDIGSATTAMAIGDKSMTIVRLTSLAESLPSKIRLQLPHLTDGEHALSRLDLDTGAESQHAVTMAGGTFEWEVVATDVVLIVQR